MSINVKLIVNRSKPRNHSVDTSMKNCLVTETINPRFGQTPLIKMDVVSIIQVSRTRLKICQIIVKSMSKLYKSPWLFPVRVWSVSLKK